jgi:site-specific DNA recombinase
MIAEAMSDDHPADVILIHSLSRLFRNALHYMTYKAKLAPFKVKFLSITQEFGDDPASDLAMNMVAVFDEYHSAENSKHVRRTMIANAKNGHWNGHCPPIGFKIVAVAQPKGKDRKILEIDPETVHIPRFIFETYVNGTTEGPIGITRLAQLLNERGERIRGRPFYTSSVQLILDNTAYMGTAYYNKRDSKTGEDRPSSEWISIPVPAIVTEGVFYSAKALRASRDPRMGEAADKTNTNLLTGQVLCGCGGDGCGGGMTTATGKSGRYRYYACRNRISGGQTVCPGRRIPMEKLDGIVVQAIADHVLRFDRLQRILMAWIEKAGQAESAQKEEIRQLKARLSRLESESGNVIKLVRNGLCSADDPQIAAELAQIANQRKAIGADIELLGRQIDGQRRITPDVLEKFSSLLSGKLKTDPVVRAGYVKLLVDRVEVGHKEIRIIGSKATLARAASGLAMPKVPKAEREWRARNDSNVRPSDS